MSRYFSLVIMLDFFSGYQITNAQDIFLGFRVGEQYANYTLSSNYNPYLITLASPYQNIHFSIPFEIRFSKNFSLQSEIGYGDKRVSLSYMDPSPTALQISWNKDDTFEYFDFMIMPTYQFNMGRFRMRLFGGPGVAKIMSMKYQYQAIDFIKPIQYSGIFDFTMYDYQRTHLTANIGVALAYDMKIGQIMLDARYQNDLTDKTNTTFVYYYDHSFQWAVGFSFYLKKRKR